MYVKVSVDWDFSAALTTAELHHLQGFCRFALHEHALQSLAAGPGGKASEIFRL